MRYVILFVGLIVMLATNSAFAGGNLVNNGGFETGDFTDWTVDLAAAGSNLSVIAQPHTGTFSAIFSAEGANYDEISQSVPTIMGEQYTLSFWIQNLGVGNDSLQVEWEGVNVLDQTPVGTELENWVEIVVSPLSASANGSELRMLGLDNISAFLIDDVSVTLVPEPSSLIGFGLAGMLLIRRRRA